MSGSPRRVEPELLDSLPPDDARARASRRDLRRIHRVMGTVSILRDAIAGLSLGRAPRRILELGAGDGSLLLRLGRALSPAWRDVELTLLDRQDLLDVATRAAYLQMGWRVEVCRGDVIDWARGAASARYDLVVTTLFLHHLDSEALRVLFAAVAARTGAFVACEPRRSRSALLASRLVALLGANAVTRGDAVKSVVAGFDAAELRACWPGGSTGWHFEEYLARPFTHCFTARHAH